MPPETASASTATDDGLALLPLPTLLHLLTDEQLRGAHCVWCCEPMDAETALDFGQHTGTVDGVDGSAWFPRACKPCVGRQARKAYVNHTRTCQECMGPEACDEHRILRRMAMELWHDLRAL